MGDPDSLGGVTAQDLRENPRADGPNPSVPRARVSRSAVTHNTSLAVAALPAGAPRVGDLRADAWGHGALAVAEAMVAAGADRFAADAAGAVALQAAGMADRLTIADPTLDPRTVLGLPGGHAQARAAMTLSGTVLSTKDLHAGEGVSYGFRYRAPADTRIALVTGGYAQGIVRSLGNQVSVTCGTVRHPIVGRVAMDVCVVEIADAPVRRGDVVVFFGDGHRGEPSLRDWEVATGMRAGELVAAVGARSAREFAE